MIVYDVEVGKDAEKRVAFVLKIRASPRRLHGDSTPCEHFGFYQVRQQRLALGSLIAFANVSSPQKLSVCRRKVLIGPVVYL